MNEMRQPAPPAPETPRHAPREALRLYREHTVAVLGPGELTLKVTDIALGAARSGRRGLLMRAIRELIGGLDLESGPVAGQLLVLYEYLVRLARDGKLDEAEAILAELSETWRLAMTRS